MLRIHFSESDLARTRLATVPDPLWETTASLHRLQTRKGRWAHADWHRTARHTLREKGLERALRSVVLPLFPRAAYFPDFLTPGNTADLDDGMESILAASPRRVLSEMSVLDRIVGAPSWAPRMAELPTRKEFVRLLRRYYEAVVAPYGERIHARVEAERTARCRGLLDGGVEGMLASLGPTMHWRRPVLEVTYPAKDRDLHLNGRGLTLVPSYFAREAPVSLADPDLPPVLWYPLPHEPAATHSPPGEPLTALLGRARATALRAAAAGATTGEIARAAGVSASSASRHATALRDAGLLTSVRDGTTVLHTLTPMGASLLRAGSGSGSNEACAEGSSGASR
ncbi:ArsR family transcriptional regulator [Streptomyces sp. NPDC015127]|uniref:ArsR family transcriptional regulator n=1 Tax=Streptomyces sp. NPDC015127 TaxID=3364939 RepID=UPI0036F4FF06